jgi:hypothetical protein
MRKLVGALTALVLGVAPAYAAPLGALDDPTGVTSDNVTFVKTVPFDAGGATGARLVGKHLYVAGATSFSIYDVSDAENPELLSHTVTGFQFANEDVDTNGRILLLSDDNGFQKLFIYDVEDKTAPVKLSELSGLNDHNWACVMDCAYAYGSRGHIVDLRDPSQPELVGHWGGGATPGDGFDTTEASRGRVLTATRTIFYLDGRKDPTDPNIVARGGTSDNRLIHSIRWPNRGGDRFILVQGETPFSGVCDEDSGAFMTWDARSWKRTGSFRMVDEFRVSNGTYTDGNPAAGPTGCTAMWFQEHPSFDDGGLVASAFFEHGVRFLQVDRAGSISERGYYMPAVGSTIAAYWITDEVVYAIDLAKGIDILRYAR